MTYPLNTLLETHLYLASSNCLINSKKLLGCFVFCSVLRSTVIFTLEGSREPDFSTTCSPGCKISGINLKNVVLLEFMSGIEMLLKVTKLTTLETVILYLSVGQIQHWQCCISSCLIWFLCHLLQADVEGPPLKRREAAFMTSYWEAVTILQCF